MRQFRSQDLGTPRDKQYRVAEKTLMQVLRGTKLSHHYQPHSSNLAAALSS